MWLFTTIGFFSVVQKSGTDFLTIRARSKTDLDNLRSKYLPELSATVSGSGTDYPFRGKVSHSVFADAMVKMVADIKYDNFKSEVDRKMGHERERIYSDVWRSLRKIENEKASR